jgi:formylglycine-generating enzyme required for sulfatase activity
VGADK